MDEFVDESDLEGYSDGSNPWDDDPNGYASSVLEKHKDKNFVKRLFDPDAPTISNPDGSYSSHRMISAGNYVLPTIVQNKSGKLITFNVKNPDNSWNQEELAKAKDYARQNNEYIPFDTEKEAQWFAENNYKRGSPMTRHLIDPDYVDPSDLEGEEIPSQPKVEPSYPGTTAPQSFGENLQKEASKSWGEVGQDLNKKMMGYVTNPLTAAKILVDPIMKGVGSFAGQTVENAENAIREKDPSLYAQKQAGYVGQNIAEGVTKIPFDIMNIIREQGAKKLQGLQEDPINELLSSTPLGILAMAHAQGKPLKPQDIENAWNLEMSDRAHNEVRQQGVAPGLYENSPEGQRVGKMGNLDPEFSDLVEQAMPIEKLAGPLLSEMGAARKLREPPITTTRIAEPIVKNGDTVGKISSVLNSEDKVNATKMLTAVGIKPGDDNFNRMLNAIGETIRTNPQETKGIGGYLDHVPENMDKIVNEFKGMSEVENGLTPVSGQDIGDTIRDYAVNKLKMTEDHPEWKKVQDMINRFKGDYNLEELHKQSALMNKTFGEAGKGVDVDLNDFTRRLLSEKVRDRMGTIAENVTGSELEKQRAKSLWSTWGDLNTLDKAMDKKRAIILKAAEQSGLSRLVTRGTDALSSIPMLLAIIEHGSYLTKGPLAALGVGKFLKMIHESGLKDANLWAGKINSSLRKKVNIQEFKPTVRTPPTIVPPTPWQETLNQSYGSMELPNGQSSIQSNPSLSNPRSYDDYLRYRMEGQVNTPNNAPLPQGAVNPYSSGEGGPVITHNQMNDLVSNPRDPRSIAAGHGAPYMDYVAKRNRDIAQAQIDLKAAKSAKDAKAIKKQEKILNDLHKDLMENFGMLPGVPN